jgi:hypothetical protein
MAMPRPLSEIRKDQEGSATVRNLVSVLHAKLELTSHYGVYEYEAGEEGLTACAAEFEQLARSEREQIGRLIELLPLGTRRRFLRRGENPEPDPPAGSGRAWTHVTE